MMSRMCTDLIINVHALERAGASSLGEQGFSATSKSSARSICPNLFKMSYLIQVPCGPQPSDNDRFSANGFFWRDVEIKASQIGRTAKAAGLGRGCQNGADRYLQRADAIFGRFPQAQIFCCAPVPLTLTVIFWISVRPAG
jgi:hypothetical protein